MSRITEQRGEVTKLILFISGPRNYKVWQYCGACRRFPEAPVKKFGGGRARCKLLEMTVASQDWCTKYREGQF